MARANAFVTRTRDRRIAIHSATLTPSLKRLCLRVGHCCRTALSDCFVEAISSFIGYHEVRGKLCRNSKKNAKQSYSAVCHDTLRSLPHRPFETQRVIKQAKRDASWERAKGASHQLLVRLSKDVFERPTSTGRGLLSFFDGDFAQTFWANNCVASEKSCLSR